MKSRTAGIRGLIFTVLVGIGFALLLYWGVNNERRQFKADSAYTIGIVSSFGFKWLKVRYQVDGKFYTAMKGSSGVEPRMKRLIQVGDTFEIQYVKSNPDLSRVKLESWDEFHNL